MSDKIEEGGFWFLLDNDLALMQIELAQRSLNGWDYFYRIYQNSKLVLAWRVGINYQAISPHTNDETAVSKPPHEIPIKNGWSLVPFMVKRHLTEMMRRRNLWQRIMDKEIDIPGHLREMERISYASKLESFSKDTASRQNISRTVASVVQALDDLEKPISACGVYMSTDLTTSNVSLGLEILRKRKAVTLITEKGPFEDTTVEANSAELESAIPPNALPKNDFVETQLPYHNFIFMMMPFEDTYWTWLNGKNGEGNGVRKFIEESTSLKCVTVDQDKTPPLIENKIYTHILKAEVCIANITKINASVFYELGIAHTLGRPVVLICDEEQYKEYVEEGIEQKEIFGKFLKGIFDVNHRSIVRIQSGNDRWKEEMLEAIDQCRKLNN